MSLDTSYPNPSVSDISNDGNITRNAPHSRNDQVAFTTPGNGQHCHIFCQAFHCMFEKTDKYVKN